MIDRVPTIKIRLEIGVLEQEEMFREDSSSLRDKIIVARYPCENRWTLTIRVDLTRLLVVPTSLSVSTTIRSLRRVAPISLPINDLRIIIQDISKASKSAGPESVLEVRGNL
jgi:hypothetical protein